MGQDQEPQSPGDGRGAALSGFKSTLTRGDVDDWLAEQAQKEAAQQQAAIRATLFWARIAGWTGIIGVVAAIESAMAGNSVGT